jgi:hypothetical protein
MRHVKCLILSENNNSLFIFIEHFQAEILYSYNTQLNVSLSDTLEHPSRLFLQPSKKRNMIFSLPHFPSFDKTKGDCEIIIVFIYPPVSRHPSIPLIFRLM